MKNHSTQCKSRNLRRVVTELRHTKQETPETRPKYVFVCWKSEQKNTGKESYTTILRCSQPAELFCHLLL